MIHRAWVTDLLVNAARWSSSPFYKAVFVKPAAVGHVTMHSIGLTDTEATDSVSVMRTLGLVGWLLYLSATRRQEVTC